MGHAAFRIDPSLQESSLLRSEAKWEAEYAASIVEETLETEGRPAAALHLLGLIRAGLPFSAAATIAAKLRLIQELEKIEAGGRRRLQREGLA